MGYAVSVPILVFAALALAGFVVGWSADGATWSAALLVAEPAWTIVSLFTVHLLLERRRRTLAWAVGFGAAAALLGMRTAPGPATPAAPPPSWSQRVSRCAAALKAPADVVRVLQWTDPPDAEAVLAAVQTFRPDVTVLFGGVDPALGDTLVDTFGGEAQTLGGALVHAQGVFQLCGEDTAWREGGDDDPAAVTFVGVPEGTVFPLVIARLPPVDIGGDWSERHEAAAARLESVVDTARADGALVVADAAAPWTFRRMDRGLFEAGVAPVIVPPSWPAEVAGLPMLTLHPYDRAWTGPGWRVESSVAVSHAGASARTPIVTTLVPAERGGA